MERAVEADLFLFVYDATELGVSPPPLPSALAARVTPNNSITIFNKSDLRNYKSTQYAPSPALQISALTGAGFEELTAAIIRCADRFQLDAGNDQIAINARHAHALTQARQGLADAQAKLIENAPVELLASDLRGTLAAYGEISGKVDNERMLDALFATFCIGK